MGQRLNIEIQDCGVALANCYYHWSGYTSSSLQLTEQILTSSVLTDEFLLAIPDKVAFAVALLRTTGADNVNRNNGLISTTESDMDQTRKWQEAGVYIDIGRQSITFNNFYYLNADEIAERELDISTLTNLDIDLEHCNFAQFSDYLNTVADAIQAGHYIVNTPKGVAAFIE